MHGTLRVTEKKINDNKPFWKTIEPFLSDNLTQKITLIEKKDILSVTMIPRKS